MSAHCCAISGFRCGVNEICALSGFYAAQNGCFLPRFREKPISPHLQSSSLRQLEMEPTCPETLINYPPTLRKIQKEPISRYFPLSRHQAWRFNRIENLHQNARYRDFCSVTNSDKRGATYFKCQEPNGIRYMHARSELKAYELWSHAHSDREWGTQHVAVSSIVGAFYSIALLSNEVSISDSSSMFLSYIYFNF